MTVIQRNIKTHFSTIKENIVREIYIDRKQRKLTDNNRNVSKTVENPSHSQRARKIAS